MKVSPALVRSALLFAVASAAVAQEAAQSEPPWIKPLIDIRTRFENVQQDGFADEASAGTVRARLGFETRPVLATMLLAEGEFLWAFDEHYNSTTNGKTQYPVVGDGDEPEINRLQLMNKSLPKTTITLGRQRINLDDQRFVGASAWRQNEQTFDSLRIVNQSIDKWTFDVAYVDQVNRVFGKASPVGRYDGDNLLINAAYQLPAGKLTAFVYQLDFEVIDSAPPAQRNAAVNDSTQTIGARFAGDHTFGKVKLAYAASYATQDDYGRNPISYSTDYYFGELTASANGFSGGLALEVLGGTGSKGFATPIATLHPFQGWADKFLTTPVNGVSDQYLRAGYSLKTLGPLQAFSAQAIYHRFDAARGPAHYGNETDLLVSAKWKKFSAALKYADYDADDLFTDTRKLWAQVEYVF
jgi:hypothetical protein